MVLFNHATREMTAKIVYYGPGLCGKTTNLMVIFDKLDEKNRGKMLSLATKTDRTLFFDLLPVDIGKIGAFNLKIQLYTVPGQVFYNETRKLVLRGADAVVFVVDSQPSMVDSNRESFANLLENLQEIDLDPQEVPIIIQYNKRDIPGVLSVEELEEQLGFEGYPAREASALRGEGVMETFTLATKVTAKHLIAKLQGKSPKVQPRGKDKDKDKKKPKQAAAPIPEPEPEAPPEPEPETIELAEEAIDVPFPEEMEVNPFADTPFEDPGANYDKVEEVSLEELLEGRERPGSLAGEVPIPVVIDDEVEPMDAGQLLPDTVAVALEDPPENASGDLRKEIESLRAENKRLKDGLRRALDELNRLIR